MSLFISLSPHSRLKESDQSCSCSQEDSLSKQLWGSFHMWKGWRSDCQAISHLLKPRWNPTRPNICLESGPELQPPAAAQVYSCCQQTFGLWQDRLSAPRKTLLHVTFVFTMISCSHQQQQLCSLTGWVWRSSRGTWRKLKQHLCLFETKSF